MPLREGLLTILVPVRRFVEAILIGTDDEPIHDGVDARYAARDRDRVLRLVGRLHPARQLDDPLANFADVDGALGEQRVVAERFELMAWM